MQHVNNTDSDPTESHYVARLVAGDEVAFRYLFDAYYPRVRAFAGGICRDVHLAEEITQITFVKLWEKRSMLEAKRPLGNFLFVVCRNLLISHVRKVQSRRKYEAYQKSFAAVSTENTAETVRVREVRGVLEAAMASMPPKRREVFRLSREQGLSYREIGEHLGISRKTVEVHISQALRFLRGQLAAKADVVYALLLLSWW
ncbi:MAG: RNA polymerase sigma-70 factor [Bacteroidota bacterium]